MHGSEVAVQQNLWWVKIWQIVVQFAKFPAANVFHYTVPKFYPIVVNTSFVLISQNEQQGIQFVH